MILFIDDEPRSVNQYLDELRLSGYKVSFQKNVEGAVRCLDSGPQQINLIILDVMMPYGTVFRSEETEQGLRTGVVFYERIRAKAPDLPVIILTNVSDPRVPEKLRQDKNCRVLMKPDYLPFEFVEAVGEVLAPPDAEPTNCA
jgi:CheY-like chemotaxis protein